jgi:hypothetical protein
MIGLIWNCQGLGASSKVQFLKELIRDEKVDLIGLQETQKSHFNDSWLDSLAGNKPFAWFFAPLMAGLVVYWLVLILMCLMYVKTKLVNS